MYFFKFLSSIKLIHILFVITMLFLILLTSCATSKKMQTNNTATTEKVETTSDKNNNTETSKAIADRIIIKTPETDDKEVLKAVEKMMKQLNTSKTSGTNSYKSKYDEVNKQWIIDFLVAQTQNKTTTTNNTSNTSKTFDQQMDAYIKKQVIPWWCYAIVIVLLWPHIKWLLNFIPGVGPFLAKVGK